ncbi:reprolysin-like metallopeptidase [Ferruginibacter sp. HRS2-29]|uniref:reprolysin-like metallopeptidase n=2 Tax=Ferruginibacter sp. HRS2-29 TaxID=2487334 RepID=UPI0020CF3F98|nr:M12 family metallo-peptidase [Ferruginibacter sp. HRS2-29]MCP9750780.1 T9SS C-terminal target domain-containing protein [Ferruginibacter sp. HRS2-29]
MRKIYQTLWAVLAVLVTSFSASAQKSFFPDIAESSIQKGTAKRLLIPDKYRTIGIKKDELKSFLWSLPSEKNILPSRINAPVMLIPMPDGTMARFNVWESSIQEAALEARFPEIKTFAGQGIDDPYATIRMDYNPYTGFHAQILSAATGRIYIDPYIKGNTDAFISYFHADNHRKTNFSCLTPDPVVSPVQNRGTLAGPCRGTQLTTYRLAIACTGEYAQAVGGGAAGPTHAAIVTSTNRITGVYEVELAIRMVLIANNNLIEYLDPATDPYTNLINTGQLNQNTSNINAVIGSANYDIGHLFTSNDNGVAYLASVCGPNKGGGATGAQVLVGDGYDIDYVAHEMGHQFGAPHTFNSNTCASAGGSYEPGGGTTIMAYAGICAANENIQPNSDAIFHPDSFDAISNFLTSGNGGCGVSTPTGNTLPVITSVTPATAIPIGTPFTLTGTATDADGDAISYNWDGWDFGTAGTWISAGTSTTRPLFRTRLSKTTGSRTFPDPRVIAANYPGLAAPSAMDGLRGEVLPQVARPMKFRLTVRDNRAGGGGVVSSGSGCQGPADIIITASGTQPFAITSPNGGESYAGNTTQTVTWNVVGTNAAPFNVTNVKISISTDGGLTFPTVLAASTANDGSEPVTMPATATTTARIKVEAIGNIFYDISNTNFTITAPVSGFGFTPPSPATVACGGPATAAVTLATTSLGGYTTPINLSATAGVPAGTTVTFGTNPVTPGNSSVVTLNNVNTLSAGTYNITITGISGAINQTQVVSFVVSPGTAPTLTGPAAQVVCAGAAASFTVTSTGTPTGYQWQVSTIAAPAFADIAGATSATYTIPATTAAQNGNQYRVIVFSCTPTGITSSAATLTVNTPVSIGTQPAASTVCSGATATFSVAATGTALTYQWQYAATCAGTFTNLAGQTAATLSLTNVTTANAGAYRVIVGGACGPVTSSCVLLTVNVPVTISTQPVDFSICLPVTGTVNGTFTVAAAGTGLTYQWQQSTDGGTNFANITGATAATLTLTNLTATMNGYKYRVVLSGTCTPSLNSAVATLTVNTPVNISAQPQNKRICSGDNATFAVTATGSTITYQWQVSVNGGPYVNVTNAGIYSGATTNTLTLTSVTTLNNGYKYRVVVSGVPCGAVNSAEATLTVNQTPTVELALQSYANITPAIRTGLFPVVSPAVGPYTYAWYKNGNLLNGVGTSPLPVSVDDFGTYTVMATNTVTGCFDVSDAVTLSDLASDALFVYPNPSSGKFEVRYYNRGGAAHTRTLSIYDSKGAQVFKQQYTLTGVYAKMAVNMVGAGAGVYFIDLTDAAGKRIATGKVVIRR